MNVFYAPDANQKKCFLPHEEALHCIRTLRLKTNDKIHVIDGKGGFFLAEIKNVYKQQCEIVILENLPLKNNRNYKLHIAIAPTKNIDRFEFFIEKAVEIGVDEITPLLCKHSEKKNINLNRLQKKMIAAAKQSVNAKFPIINNITSINEVLDRNHDSKFIAHCRPGNSTLLQKECKNAGDAIILIGPEGDFSEEEIKLAQERNYISVSLGDNRYRTETAGILACYTFVMLV